MSSVYFVIGDDVFLIDPLPGEPRGVYRTGRIIAIKGEQVSVMLHHVEDKENRRPRLTINTTKDRIQHRNLGMPRGHQGPQQPKEDKDQ